MPDDPTPLGRGDLAIQRLDCPIDLGNAAIIHGLAVIADPRGTPEDRWGGGGAARERLAAGTQIRSCRHLEAPLSSSPPPNSLP